MEVYVFEGKNVDELKNKALENLKLTENDLLFKEEQKKGGLFKGTVIKLSVIKISDIVEYVKNFLNNLLTSMDLQVTFESNIREKQINIKMFSDNNAILIGKNGQTLSAITTIVKQYVYIKTGIYPFINMDVENYKDKQIIRLERLAKNIAREVIETHNSVAMDNMNSYERRIVHNCLADFKGITTDSEGEDPNRHIVIRPKKD